MQNKEIIVSGLVILYKCLPLDGIRLPARTYVANIIFYLKITSVVGSFIGISFCCYEETIWILRFDLIGLSAVPRTG